jgi:hypothetical protein
MDEDVEFEFDGNPECPSCGALAGTTSDRPIPAPHPNCACPNKHKCNNRYDFSATSTRYGPEGRCFILNADITVRCWDGTEIGESVPIDMGCAGGDTGTDWEAVWDEVGTVAATMADGCPDCNPRIVS